MVKQKFPSVAIVCLLLWGAILVTYAQSGTNEMPEIRPQQNPSPAPQTPQEEKTKTTTPENRRIVDPAKFPKTPPDTKQQPGSKLDRILTKFETAKVMEQIKLILNDPNIHIRFGGLGDGSGFGGGVEFTTNPATSPNVHWSSVIHVTARQYLLTTAGVSVDPTKNKRERWQLDFTGRYQLRPSDNFYGLGFNSQRGNRSTYNLQERGFNFMAIYKITKSLHAGVGLDFSSSRIFDGKDRRFAKTPVIFPTLAGLTRGASLLSPQAFLEFDKRNEPNNATQGFYAHLSASSNDSVGKDDFGFVNWRFDARGYVPLGTPRRVLAARLLGNFNHAKGGSEIPFFRLARIGDTQTLRGFRSLRYYGRNALAANIEYRFELIPGIGAMAFTDVGQVFDRRAQLSAKNMRATYGGGIEFKSKKSTLLRFLVGKSAEGTRVIIGFGPSF